MYCKVCANEIEQERLDILPATVFCAPCAIKLNVVKPRKGIMVWHSKDCAEMQTMSSDYFEKNKAYFLPNSGLRSVVKNFSKNVCA
jgi:hypothetical protein